MAVTVSDVHIDAALSEIAIAYKNPEANYIADQVFPVIRSAKQSNKYYIWKKDHWFRNAVEDRAPGTPFPMAQLELSKGNYYCDVKHLGYQIPDENIANQDDAVEEEAVGTEYLADQFMLHREKSFVDAFFKTSVWLGDATPSTLWSVGGDPIGDIDTGKRTVHKSTGMEPNVLLMGPEVWDVLKVHDDIIDLYKHTSPGILTEQQVASALGVERILIGKAVENTANWGATFSGSYLFGKNALLLYVPPRPGRRVPASGYTFVWDSGGDGLTTQISRLRNDFNRRLELQAMNAYDQKVVGSDLGYFVNGAVA